MHNYCFNRCSFPETACRRVCEFPVYPDEDIGDYHRWLNNLSLTEFLDAIDDECDGKMPEGFMLWREANA